MPDVRSQEPAQRAFTLTELMVVLGMLTLLLLLMPALGGTRQPDRSAVCLNNLRQIGQGMLMYASDYNDTLFNASGAVPNGGKWYSDPLSTNLLSPADGDAYWGVAYLRYLNNSREVFRCPSARMVDEWRDAGLAYPSEFWLFSTYGVSRFLTQSFSGTNPAPVRLRANLSPGTMILAQDAAEASMEGPDDSLGLFPGKSQLLAQWSLGSGLSTLYGNYDFQWEWYRHDQRCNTIFISGSAAKIRHNGLNQGIDYRYYTGDRPLLALP
jgi:type II secretory pathway pseudopilin PulG